MKQDKDWIEVMRSTLRDAEIPPPADGWARLERELGKAPAPRVPAWRIHWPRIAAAAAAIMICIAAGEYLWNTDLDLKGYDGNVISEAVGGGSAVDSVLSEKTEGGLAAALALNTAASAEVESAAVQRVKTSVRNAAPIRKPLAMQQSAQIPTSSEVKTPMQAQVSSEAIPENNAAKTELETQENRSAASAVTRSKSATRASTPAARQTPQASSRTLYEDDFVAYMPPRKKASFSLYGGGGVTGGRDNGFASRAQSDPSNSPVGTGGSGGSISLMKQYDYALGSFRHHQPLSFGLSVRKEFAHGFSLESGVNYTFLHSDVSLFSGSEKIAQKLHFIGVPLRVNWEFYERGRFSLYIGAGGMLEKCVSARFDGKTFKEPKVQWSVLGAAGAQYRLGGTVGLYFEPEVSYYFTDTELRTVRTDSPLTLTLRMGVRLSF